MEEGLDVFGLILWAILVVGGMGILWYEVRRYHKEKNKLGRWD